MVAGRELYAWHPDGVARSKLWNELAGKELGVTATARNWTTVTNLLAMADAVMHDYVIADVFTDVPAGGQPGRGVHPTPRASTRRRCSARRAR